MVFDGLACFVFTKIYERTYHSKSRAVQVSFGSEGLNLPRVKEAHKKRFHGIIMMVGVCNLVEIMLQGIAVDRAPAEKSTAEAWTFFRMVFDDVSSSR